MRVHGLAPALSDGLIQAVDSPAPEARRVLDGKGATVIQGFIDGGSHLLRAGLDLWKVQLWACRHAAALLTTIEAQTAASGRKSQKAL
ncbi:MAG: hypothetical protein ACREJL_01050 [Candidatus Methylomirabilales bacterium]